jgi:hypothetical protein
MSAAANVAVLRERLGEDGTACLVKLLEETRQEVKEEVTANVSDRFERRLAEECGAIRLEMAKGFAKLETTLIKWCFVFWIGQAVALAGVLLTLTGVILTYLKIAAA